MHSFRWKRNYIYLSCGIFPGSPVEVAGWVVEEALLSLSTNDETNEQKSIGNLDTHDGDGKDNAY